MTEQEQTRIDTRNRLLEAAAEIYAELGYRNARVRDICDRAGANVAAVNYHFGDKQQLYEEVLRYAFFSLAGDKPAGLEPAPHKTADQRLHAFVKFFLAQLLSSGRSALYAKLVAREMSDPTFALERVVEDGMRPQLEIVLAIVRDLLGKGADEQLVRRCAGSILGQCLFYHFAGPAILRLPLEETLDASAIEPLTEHVTRFSLGALKQLARASGKR